MYIMSSKDKSIHFNVRLAKASESAIASESHSSLIIGLV